jgi:hypothetical protein
MLPPYYVQEVTHFPRICGTGTLTAFFGLDADETYGLPMETKKVKPKFDLLTN